MPPLNWDRFGSLAGAPKINFENLCRSLMVVHFGKSGQLKARSNQPGVEFHINLHEKCALGGEDRWFGWQCKWHERNASGNLNAAAKRDIVDSLNKTIEILPELTDWILWTPYTLSKSDQQWFYGLTDELRLQLWAEEELDTFLCGDGLLLRHSYFGDLALTPGHLKEQHQISIQLIKKRWMEIVHQPVRVERALRRCLGEPGSWEGVLDISTILTRSLDNLKSCMEIIPESLQGMVGNFIEVCESLIGTLGNFHDVLKSGDLIYITQQCEEYQSQLDHHVRSVPKYLRSANNPLSLDVTNLLADMELGHRLLSEASATLRTGFVAVLANAGDGKTQLAAQLTAPNDSRPAGILLHGRDLHRGQDLDELAKKISVYGEPVANVESLLATLNAAGQRSGCRLPLVIDGLNEAENPKDWLAPLSRLNEIVNKYPNVLVVCTLRTGEKERGDNNFIGHNQASARESFAVMALPDDVKRLELNGFGGDTFDAVQRYFEYYKIKCNNVDVPYDLFSQPLSLRIFCELTNPAREQDVEIDYIPPFMTSIFVSYISNTIDRIIEFPNLSRTYQRSDIEAALYHLGIQLWESGSREIDEKSFRDLINDSETEWNSSLVNLLAQEGIIFRNPGEIPGEHLITPVFDALGGCLIANSLLTKYKRDRDFEWLKQDDSMSLLHGDSSHYLAQDIFDSLVALTPVRMYGQQLWQAVPDEFKTTALIRSIELDRENIDEHTINVISDLLIGDEDSRHFIFEKITSVRGVPDHPFNSRFLDSILSQLPVSIRDLSWSEWLRKSRHGWSYETRRGTLADISAIEEVWTAKLDKRTEIDYLYALWIKWHLTSTDREIRDRATRALYWYGRGDQYSIISMAIESLATNDPYVPERLFAAAYGAIIAFSNGDSYQEFITNALPEISLKLYERIFSAEALDNTSHLLIREYASGILQFSLKFHPDLLNEEQVNRCTVPYVQLDAESWGESGAGENYLSGLGSPFKMDFENYTLGSLVPGRANYDYDNPDYIKLRARILWRVEQLGWSNERFGTVDKEIERESDQMHYRNSDVKLDRYGKKYSWIAFYEMSGVKQTQEELDEWRERTSNVDIDPTFPCQLPSNELINADFLGDIKEDTKSWMENPELPDFREYLRVENLLQNDRSWVLLDSFFKQQDEVRGRSMFNFSRAIFINRDEFEEFYDLFSGQDFGGRWLPETPDVYYTFAGEIPWSNIYKSNEIVEMSFVISEEPITIKKTTTHYLVKGKKVDHFQYLLLRHGPSGMDDEFTEEEILNAEIVEEETEVQETQQTRRSFNVRVPVKSFSWESYHSILNQSGGAVLLDKDICSSLDLNLKPQSFDFYSKDGEQVTASFSNYTPRSGNYQKMLFIKKEYLDEYLSKNDLVMVWGIWGERGLSTNEIMKWRHSDEKAGKPYIVYSYADQYNGE